MKKSYARGVSNGVDFIETSMNGCTAAYDFRDLYDVTSTRLIYMQMRLKQKLRSLQEAVV